MKTIIKKLMTLLILAVIANPLRAHQPVAGNNKNLPLETPEAKEKRMQWWSDARFGMFIHWGLYAVPARHEWVKKNEKLTNAQYQKYFDVFNPDLFAPEEWAKMAKAAGMKYMVITTKHHEGFCLWDSKYTDYKAPNTPAHQDLLRRVVDAFRKEGIRIGFYYSLLDWHHPDFPVDKNHPQWDDGRGAALNKNRDIKIYQQYIKDQLGELLSNYGKIDELFLDFSYPGANGKGHEDWDSENVMKLIRKLQPQIIVNDRLDLNEPGGWDYKTPEQFMPQAHPQVNGVNVPWETCQTFSGSWGYFRDEDSWKSPHQLIAMLIESVSKGGNLLLNVGPNARGQFDYRANERLTAIADWMKFNSKSIYDCGEAPGGFKKPDNCLMTYNATKKRLYLHFLDWPTKSVVLEGYRDKIKYAQLLADGSEVIMKTTPKNISYTTQVAGPDDVILELPVHKPMSEIPVIELILN